MSAGLDNIRIGGVKEIQYSKLGSGDFCSLQFSGASHFLPLSLAYATCLISWQFITDLFLTYGSPKRMNSSTYTQFVASKRMGICDPIQQIGMWGDFKGSSFPDTLILEVENCLESEMPIMEKRLDNEVQLFSFFFPFDFYFHIFFCFSYAAKYAN